MYPKLYFNKFLFKKLANKKPYPKIEDTINIK